MKKHLIIHGSAESGKSILAKVFSGAYSTLRIEMRNPKALEDHFLFDYVDAEDTELIWFEEINMKFTIDEFLNQITADKLKIERKHQDVLEIDNPRYILDFSDRVVEGFTLSVRDRFHIIDTDIMSYSEIIEILKIWNKSKL